MTKQVHAKMWCTKASPQANGPGEIWGVEVELSAVYEKEGPNAEWSTATPCGKIQMTITNPAAYEQFKVGKLYLVAFEETSK